MNDETISKGTGLSAAQIKRLMGYDYSYLSIDEKPGSDVDMTLLDLLPSAETLNATQRQAECQRLLPQYLDQLNKRERTILIL